MPETFDLPHGATFLLGLRITLAGAAVTHILLKKTEPSAVIAWAAFVILFPLAGSVFYWIFGINRQNPRSYSGHTADYVSGPVAQGETSSVPDLEQVGWRVMGHNTVDGNRIRLLRDGEQAYPEMLGAIRSAQSEVLLMTYLFERDDVGREFIAALVTAQARGVRVGVLIDDVGRRHNFPTVLSLLRQAGLPTITYNPLRLFPPNVGFNLRNHRKMLIVDREIAFAGGMNIGARHLIQRPSNEMAADMNCRVEGPLVALLAEVFCRDWARSGGAQSPAPPPTSSSADKIAGDVRCRIVTDGPDQELGNLVHTIQGVIAAARRRVVIMTPYFLPEPRIVGALQAAALRGVTVTVIIPSRCNWRIVRWALNHQLSDILRVGICVWEQPPPFAHTKCLIIDDEYALVGSANIDARSLRLNYEIGIEVFNQSFCAELSAYAEGLLVEATRITLNQWQRRPFWQRLRDAMANLLTPYL